MEEQQEKILYIGTKAGDDPEKAAMPFVMGNAALAMDIEATVCLQGSGVYLAQKGYAQHTTPPGGFPPIKGLIESFLELGGKIKVCVPCLQDRNIDESDLVEGAEVTAGGKINLMALEADAVFVY
ncbi:MAG: DsrE family protein [Thermodesulfobacteriota bacterium]